MNFGDIKKRVASYINRLNTDDVIVDADVTESDIANYINDRYREEIFPAYSNIRQSFYTQESTAPAYQESGTIASVSTTTLNTTEGIFSDNMIGAKVYNLEQEETIKIVGYTDTTTVTMDSTVAAWEAGDTIYVITGTYVLAGDLATDYVKSTWVGIKYNYNDEDFQRASIYKENDYGMFGDRKGRSKDEEFNQLQPKYFFDTVDVGGSPQSVITIRPIPDYSSFIDGDGNLVTDREPIFVKYVEFPKALSNDTDVPRLPLGFHDILVFGATADCLRKMEKYQQSQVYEQLFMNKFKRLMRSQNAERPKSFINFKKDKSVRIINLNG